jgi:AAA domain-containing protein
VASPHPPAPPPHERGERHLRPVHETPHEPPPEGAHEPGTGTGTGTDLVPARRVWLTSAQDVPIKPTYWLWEDRIPAGALTLGPGREGIGKSLFCCWLSGQVTAGTLPGVHRGRPRSVIYAATEDSWERTIAGRLRAAEADLSRVFRIEVTEVDGTPVPLSLPADCAALAEVIPTYDVGLIIVDPLISAVDSRINPNQDRELRRALEPLVRLADDTGAAVFGLAHFNKASGTDALSRVTGSRAFAAVARAAIAFARDPDAEDGSCVISQVKSNLGRLDVPSLRYQVDTITLDTEAGPGQWGKLRMLGDTDTHVEEILRASDSDTGGDEDPSARTAAGDWLCDYLTSQGGGATCAAVTKAARAVEISPRTLARARKSLGVTTKAEGFPRTTFWRLP